MRIRIASILVTLACSSSSTPPSGDAGDAAVVDASNDVVASGDVASPSDAGSPIEVALSGCPQAGYTAPFHVGSGTFDLVVDTGSAELGVASNTCASCNGVSPLYTPSQSAQDEHATDSVTYVSGSGFSGEIFRDAFGVGNVTGEARLVSIQSQSGGFFTNGGCAFGDVPFTFEGIAGFGPSALATSGTDEPMAVLATAGLPDAFAVAICGSGGHMWLGGFDSSFVTSLVVYTPLLNNAYYAVRVDGIRVGATSVGATSTDIDDVVVDTDTTELELPTSVYDSVRNAIGTNAAFVQHFGGTSFFDDGNCIPPLDSSPPTPSVLDAALPTLTLQVDDGQGGSNDVTWSATSSYLEPIESKGVTYYCPEIEPRLGTSTVLGSALMRSHVVIFDRAKSRVGFASSPTCD